MAKVTVIEEEEKPSEESPPNSESNQIDQAVVYGQMVESHRQMTAKIAELDSKLSLMESQGQDNSARYQALSAQLSQLTAALAAAEAEEEEEGHEEVEQVIPPEPEPETPPPPKKKKNIFQKIIYGG